VAERRRTARTARHAALDLLARREHSRAELRDKLAAKDFEEDEVDAAVEKLAGEGLVSDARFVEAFVSSHVRRGHGPVRIRAELSRRGVAAELLAPHLEAQDWGALARDVRRRRFGAGPPADLKDRARQHRFLEFRGFSSDHIRLALGADES
jgi:regulatory protein